MSCRGLRGSPRAVRRKVEAAAFAAGGVIVSDEVGDADHQVLEALQRSLDEFVDIAGGLPRRERTAERAGIGGQKGGKLLAVLRLKRAAERCVCADYAVLLTCHSREPSEHAERGAEWVPGARAAIVQGLATLADRDVQCLVLEDAVNVWTRGMGTELVGYVAHGTRMLDWVLEYLETNKVPGVVRRIRVSIAASEREPAVVGTRNDPFSD